MYCGSGAGGKLCEELTEMWRNTKGCEREGEGERGRRADRGWVFVMLGLSMASCRRTEEKDRPG